MLISSYVLATQKIHTGRHFMFQAEYFPLAFSSLSMQMVRKKKKRKEVSANVGQKDAGEETAAIEKAKEILSTGVKVACFC